MTRDVIETLPDGDAGDGRPKLPANIRTHLGDHLRTVYDRLGTDEQPGRFAELI